MINGKPNLIFGDGAMPAAASQRGGKARQAVASQGMGRTAPAQGNFASYLSQETGGVQTPSMQPMLSPSKPLAIPQQEGALLSPRDNLAISQAMQQTRTPQTRVVSPTAGKLPFGMEDTRPGKGRNSQLTMLSSQNTLGSQPALITSGGKNGQRSANRAVQSAPSFQNGMDLSAGVDIGSAPRRGLNIIRDTNGAMAMSVGKQRKGNPGASLLTGDSTQALLQIFREQGGGRGYTEPPLAPSYIAENKSRRGIALPQPTPVQAAAGGRSNTPFAGPITVTAPESSSTQAAQFGASKNQAGKTKPFATPPFVAQASPQAPATSGESGAIGTLAAKFESGEQGIAAIGYDRTGGTSYGKFQISSRAGTMSKFMDYLSVNAPDIATKLTSAGPANTGGRSGKMPQAWQAIAAAEPTRFEQLQTDFILSSHFQPAMSTISESTGVAFASLPPALQEVVFSTAVQHGPNGAARIVTTAMQKVGVEKLTDSTESNSDRTEQDLIRQIYALRSRQFGSSTSSVRAAVQNRLKEEMQDALTMLKAASADMVTQSVKARAKVV